MNLSLRPERPGDDEFLFGLYAGTRAAEMALAPWSDAQKEAFLRSQFQLQRTHYRRYYPNARFDVIEEAGLPVGRLYVHRTPGEIRLMDIALIPNYRNRGLGAMLMRQLAAEAQVTASRITLHVEADNPALRLYERLGFRALKTNGPYLFMEWRPDSPTSQAPAESHGSDAGA
jgi:ribosomal protein S18 acetylase RimI-like enzyme